MVNEVTSTHLSPYYLLTVVESPPAPPVLSFDDLLEPFHEAETCRSRWLVGTEAEKFGVFKATYEPIGYRGDRGVQGVFGSLINRHGWFAEREHQQGEVISLRRGASSITLEPGCQLELSGAPQETIHQTCAEFSGHLAELRHISEDLGVTWLGLGFHPFARQTDLEWVPKLRYRVMREYLPTRGRYALDMMQRTATVQANFDYESETDAMRKLRVSLRVSPIVTAMFANSPWIEGEDSGLCSARARVWLSVDPDRSGILPFAWGQASTYRDYVEWALDVPMFLIKRQDTIVHNTGQTFRAFLNDGFEGHRATQQDWEQHLNTLFPEVRLKKTLEVRGADGQSMRLTCALPALWKGLLYDEVAFEKVERLTDAITPEGAELARPAIAERGLQAELQGRGLTEWAGELLSIAEGGLQRRRCFNQNNQDESVYLNELQKLVQLGQTPADQLREAVANASDFKAAVLRHAEL